MWKNKKMRDRIDNIEIINLHSQISKILYIERDIDDRDMEKLGKIGRSRKERPGQQEEIEG